MKFAGKVVVVTGAAAGIGRAITRQFLEQGAHVHAVDINGAALRALQSENAAQPGTLTGAPCDVSDEGGVNAVISAIAASGGPIAVLVNNAGINPSPASITATAPALWQRILANNLSSVYMVSRAVIPHMERGAIVNIGSILGLTGARNCAAYAAAKGGIVALTKSMALDYAPKIRVNCICPGAVDTSMFAEYVSRCPDPAAERRGIIDAIPLQRLGMPDDVAHAALFLASDEAGWITGASLIVDGGDSL